MRVAVLEHNRDTTGWGVVGLILALMTSPDLLMQAAVVVLFPAIGWMIMYFLKRELTYRFPPKVAEDESLDKFKPSKKE